jgi:hypothetical protein
MFFKLQKKYLLAGVITTGKGRCRKRLHSDYVSKFAIETVTWQSGGFCFFTVIVTVYPKIWNVSVIGIPTPPFRVV